MDARPDVSLAAPDSLAPGLVAAGLGGATAVFSDTTGAVVAGGGTLLELDLAGVAGDEGRELSGVFRSIRGTISAARTRVPAAPMMKYFNEPLEVRGLGTRLGAAMVTFTLGNEETGICDGALGLST